MAATIVIVSFAAWARRSLWWDQVQRAERAGLPPRTAILLIAYFRAQPDVRTGAISVGEATLLRGWATTVTGWRERASQGQYPLTFTTYASAASDSDDIGASHGR